MTHPSDEQLRAFATGRITDSQAAPIEAHLDTCEECGRLLDRLTLADDPLLRALRASGFLRDRLPNVSGKAPPDTSSDGDAGVEAANDLSNGLSTDAPEPWHFERYAILGELGRGGMGVVYRAFDPRLHRTVALKVMASQQFASDEERFRFRREAEAAARLQHANIVQVFEFGEHEGQPYCVFEFVDGGSLAERIATGEMAVRQAAEMLAVLADAAEYAHRRQLIHRDLKPANVLLTANDTPKIADFGLVKLLDDDSARTTDGTLIGSPSYMAPEQAAGRSADIGPATDVHALGAIFYEMLCGRPPFQGENVIATLDAVRQQEPIPPSRFCARLDRDAETICLKCLEKSPARRYPSAAALAADLRCYLAGTPISARKAGIVERGVKWAKKHPAVAVLSGLLALSLVAILVTLAVYSLRLGQALAETNRRWDQSRRNLYCLQLQRAAPLTVTDPIRARELLEDASHCPEDLRDFSWKYLKAACQRQLPALGGVAAIRSLAVATDGKRFATGDANGEVTVWSADGAAEPRRLSGHRRPITDIAFHPHKAILVTASEDMTIRIWDLQTGQTSDTMRPDAGWANGVAFAPDGTWFATAHSDHTVHIWQTDSKQAMRTLTGHADSVFRVAVSADGARLASASKDETLRLWDTRTWTQIGAPLEHQGWVTGVEFHPKNSTVFASSATDRMVRLWQCDGESQPTLKRTLRGFGDSPSGVAFSPDGNRLAAGSYDSTIRVWDVETGEPATTLRCQDARLVSVKYVGAQKLLGAALNGWVYPWLTEPGGRPRSVQSHRAAIEGTGYTPDGRTIVTAGVDHAIRLWDAETGTLLDERSHPDHWVSCLALAKHDPSLAWDWGGTLNVARIERSKLIGVKTMQERLPSSALGLALSADGKRLAVGGVVSGEVQIYQTATGRLERSLEVPDAVRCAAFLPRGDLLVAGDGGRVWLTGPETSPRSLAVLPETQTIRCLAASPDNRQIAAGSETGVVVLFDLQTGTPRATLAGHAGAIVATEFSADGKTLASAGADGDIRLWDPVTGSERFRFSVGRSLTSLALAPDGMSLTAGDEDGRLHIWRVGL